MRITRVLLAGLLSLWTALAPVAAAFAAGPTPAQTDAAIVEIRTLDGSLADEAARLKRDVDALLPEKLAAGAALPKASAETIAELDRRAHEFIDHAQILIDKKKLKSKTIDKAINPVFFYLLPRLFILGLEATPMHLAEISTAMSEIERRAAALDADTMRVKPADDPGIRAPFSERLNALNAEGTRVWNRLHTTALNIDDLGDRLTFEALKNGEVKQLLTEAGKLDRTANPLQTRVAELSKKLQAIDLRLHGSGAADAASAAPAQSEALRARMNGLLTDPFGGRPSAGRTAGGPASSGGNSGKGGAAAAAAAAAALPRAAPAKTLLDITHVPSPASAEPEGPPGPKPPVFAGGRGRDSAPKDTAAVNALRAAGGTRTIGNPEKRAKFVYQQEGETCAIAAQVQVLADADAIKTDPKSLKAKEDELYRQALALGYFAGSAGDAKRRFHGGTNGEYLGDLLDTPMRKRFGASEDDLFKAASTGRIVIVSFKTSALWNSRKFNGGHVVAVTGVEVNRADGKPLGYYINDTGTNEGGRFITVKQFMAAWKVWGSVLIEPL